jgi:hypothetical protein
MNRKPPRDINPDDAHSIAPDLAGDASALVRGPEREAVAHAVASAAFARGP